MILPVFLFEINTETYVLKGEIEINLIFIKKMLDILSK